MKGNLKTFWFITTAAWLMLGSGSCKKHKVDPVQKRTQELTASWELGTVENDDVDVTAQFEDFVLTVDSSLNFSVVNGGNAWPSTGQFTLNTSDTDTLLRNDGVTVTIDKVTSTTLILSFRVSGLSGGRLNGITGDFTFSLQKQ